MTAGGGPDPPSRQPAQLLVSVWFETGGWGGFRARISSTDADGRLASRAATADPEQVLLQVRAWLADLEPPPERDRQPG